MSGYRGDQVFHGITAVAELKHTLYFENISRGEFSTASPPWPN